MHIYLLALLIGVVAGLRTMIAPAAVSWAAYLGWLPLQNTPVAFLGNVAVPYILTVLAVIELIGDQLPKTPSRKVPVQFGARSISGLLCGGAIGATAGMFPAAKFKPVSCTPASSTARTNVSTSRSAGTGAAKGHQNSTASNPASRAACGRCSNGRSVNRIEQFTV